VSEIPARASKRRGKAPVGAVLGLLVGFGMVAAAAQATGQVQPHTDARVEVPTAPHGEFDYATVTVDNFTQIVHPGGEARFDLAAATGDNLKVKVTLTKTGFGVKQWEKEAVLNGSGHVDYLVLWTGTGLFEQWPLIRFTGTSHLDVSIDDTLTSTTDFSKGLSPGHDHLIQWKSGNTLICSTTINVPVNVTRTYRCNSQTHTVEMP
jgi:hypothetical protein